MQNTAKSSKECWLTQADMHRVSCGSRDHSSYLADKTFNNVASAFWIITFWIGKMSDQLLIVQVYVWKFFITSRRQTVSVAPVWFKTELGSSKELKRKPLL